MASLRKNISYQLIYQILNLCIPLFTTPYISRILGAKNIGIFTFTQSVINYFTLFAMLGISNYGIKTIAAMNCDKIKKSQTFFSIYAVQFLSSIVILFFYIIYIIFFCKENRLISCIQGIYILATLTDISWLYFGDEKFDITVKIGIFIRLLSVLSIFIFIKSSTDLWIYTIIMPSTLLFNHVFLWFNIHKVINFKLINRISIKDIIPHIKPILILFLPLLAMSAYQIMDKTMLGIMAPMSQSGYYASADKLISIPLALISCISTVMLSKSSNLINNGQRKESNELFSISLNLVVLFSIGLSCGIFAVAKEFVPLFFGKNFFPVIKITYFFCPILFINSISNLIRMQYLIPNNQEKIYIQAVIIGSVLNIISNLILIPKLYAIGAVIGSIIAELSAFLWQLVKIHKHIKLNKEFLTALIYLTIGILMIFVVQLILNIVTNEILGIIMSIIIGGSFYLGLSFIFLYITKNPIVYLLFAQRKI